MPKYTVGICDEVWKYYNFVIEADTSDEANEKCRSMMDSENFEWPAEPDNTDGNGWVIVSTKLNPEK